MSKVIEAEPLPSVDPESVLVLVLQCFVTSTGAFGTFEDRTPGSTEAGQGGQRAATFFSPS
jgi:hypothetical protein